MTSPALLVMDLQHGILARYGDVTDYLTGVAKTADAARAAGVPVVHVGLGFRPGHPEVSRRNLMFAAVADAGGMVLGEESARFRAEVEPAAGELVVTKKRVSAFAGSDLDAVLRATGVDHLVLAGCATSGVVLSTVRQAADLDYRVTVLADACIDFDPEVHDLLTERVFPRQATVVTAADWIGGLDRKDGNG